MAKRDYNPATDGPVIARVGAALRDPPPANAAARFLAATSGPRLLDAERPAVEVDWAKAIHNDYTAWIAGIARMNAAGPGSQLVPARPSVLPVEVDTDVAPVPDPAPVVPRRRRTLQPA